MLLTALVPVNYTSYTWIFTFSQPVPTPKRPNEEELEDSDEDSNYSSKVRRLNKHTLDRYSQSYSTTLPTEPAITDKEREDILRFVENEVTEVSFTLELQ